MTKYALHDAPPPPSNSGRSREHFPEDLLEELRDNPGQWAIGATTKNTTQATYWRKRLPDFTIVSRKNEDGGYDHWITYEPKEDA